METLFLLISTNLHSTVVKNDLTFICSIIMGLHSVSPVFYCIQEKVIKQQISF